MKLPKDMSRIHHEIFQNRESAVKSTHRYGTFRLTKSGAVSKLVTTTHATEDEATKKACYLMDVNPGSFYVVKAI
jgi:hypothetical protein